MAWSRQQPTAHELLELLDQSTDDDLLAMACELLRDGGYQVVWPDQTEC
ncbi:hypothetical protein KR52_05690 [Synechococcus sp. KORDI-52]|nr:hypothetical protein [Synechococcus sp. KORDI-52]AII48633.1 hypothetical protein KR52_05690 [Synechococcus sp. KORDI-52]